MAADPGSRTFAIARLHAGDAAALSALLTAASEREPESFVSSPGDPDLGSPALARRLADPDEHVLVARAGAWIGTATFTRQRRAKRRHKAELHRMYVVPEWRGRGVGAALLDHVLRAARGMPGLEEVSLIVACHNPAAVSLYERHGFERLWTERGALKLEGGYVDAHHMTLRLGP
jgi:ribosomal protein S18 acetylase RimI-like enzyme